jgi:hypothetical protein
MNCQKGKNKKYILFDFRFFFGMKSFCINHKCKKAGLKISQNDERVVPTGPTHEIEDVFSQYETMSFCFAGSNHFLQ